MTGPSKAVPSKRVRKQSRIAPKANETARETLVSVILTEMRDLPSGKSMAPADLARAMFASSPQGLRSWQDMLPRVRETAVHLARTDRASIIRKGHWVSPDNLRGVWRLAGPQGGGFPAAAADDLDLADLLGSVQGGADHDDD